MFKFHQKIFFAMSLLMTTVAVAAPSKITFSANKSEYSSHYQQTLLKGNVNVLVNNKIKIAADEVLVKYADKHQHKIAEFIIHGKGTLQENNHTIQFANGTFNPHTLKLSAKTISHQ